MVIISRSLAVFSLIFITSCGGGGGGMGDDSSSGGGYGNMNTAPTITNTSLNISVEENQTSAFTVTATDSNGDSLTYSISGDDSSLMSISDTGVVTFNAAPDFEVPSDANADNVYMIVAAVSDGSLSDSKTFQVTVTNDTSDDRVDSAWDGTIIKDGTYSPAFDKHAIVHNIVVAAFPDVSDEFLTHATNILDRMLQKDAVTDDTRRDLLLSNFSRDKFLQRIGSIGPENYPNGNPGLDAINNEYEVVDFIWEIELNDEIRGKTQVQANAQQINEIVEHLLHTVTNGFNKTFNSWDYQNQSSALNLAMAEAIDGNYYDVESYEEIRDKGDLEGYKNITAQEFIYWVILTGWDLKTPYKPNTAPEWYVENSEELQTKLPLAYELFINEVNGVLVNPTKEYLDGLTFSKIILPIRETVQVSIEANNSGSGNVYVIDGVQNKSLTLKIGTTYEFDHSTSHPLRFSTTSDGTHGGGAEYTTGVTTSSGSTVIEVTANTATSLYYYCSIHSGMGGTISVTE
jgi:plastocyanin